MKAIEWHDLTNREYSECVVTSHTGGSTWLRWKNLFFVAPVMTPVQLDAHFWRSPSPVRVQVWRPE